MWGQTLHFDEILKKAQQKSRVCDRDNVIRDNSLHHDCDMIVSVLDAAVNGEFAG